MSRPGDDDLTRPEAISATIAAEVEQIDALNRRADELQVSDAGQACEVAQQAHRRASAIDYPQGLGRSLYHWGSGFLRLAEYATAQELLSRGLAIGCEIGDRTLEADCLDGLGVVCYRLADNDQALDYCRRALALYEELQDGRGRSQALNDIGNVYAQLNDYSRALPCFLESLREREARQDNRGTAALLNNIGNVYKQLGDFDQALDRYLRCLGVCRQHDLRLIQARVMTNLADVYGELDRCEEALETCRLALEFDRLHQCREDEFLILRSWGDVYAKMGRYEPAMPLFQEALQIARSYSDRGSECEILASLGVAVLAMGDFERARSVLSEVVTLAESIGFKNCACRAYRGLSEIHERDNASAEALACFKKFHQVEREIFNDDADRRTRTLMVQMEVEQAQKEAEIHRQKNDELAAANAALARADAEKSLLLEQLQAQAEELCAQAEELERQATTDGLTGLYNRRYLEESLARQCALAQHSGVPLAVALIDVDHFKQVNDRFGHQIGDAVLRAVGQLLCSACRPSDVAARYGGEEFLLTLLGSGETEVGDFCERLRRQVEAFAWETIHPELAVTVSMGLSEATPWAYTPKRLIDLADQRLYEAKRLGRNRICCQATLQAA